ncbi:MAG: cobalamin B12-binding domain-containing protein [Theionarchaea archaeon]|nr:cobalamin B12-binding domain-containing protein [Theionarchaea archaeon]
MKVVMVDSTKSGIATIPSLGVLYVASVMEKAGNEVKVELLSLSDDVEKIGKNVSGEDPELIGISCLHTANMKVIPDIARSIRNYTDAPIMVGGTHPTIMYEDVLKKCPEIDFVVRGEAELTVVELGKALENDEPLSRVKGIAYRDNGNIVATEKRPYIADIDTIPFPARHLIPMEKFKPSSRGNMITSRGCPLSCIHCCVPQVYGSAFRARTPENIVKEIKELITDYDINYIKFVDDTSGVDRNRVADFCDLIMKENLDISWGAKASAGKLDEPLLKKMKEAGCQELFFTILSSHQKSLDMIGNKAKIDVIERAIKLTQKAGIKVTAIVFIGVPFETKQEVLETIKFAEALNLTRIGLQLFGPVPGSEVYYNLEKYGITMLKEDEIPQYEFNPVASPIIETSELTKEDIVELAMKAVEIRLEARAKYHAG